MKRFISIFCLAVALFCSCQKTEQPKTGDELSFSVGMGVGTKGTQANISTLQSQGFSIYGFEGTTAKLSATAVSYNSGKWAPSTPYFWKSGTSMSFIAYYPTTCTARTFSGVTPTNAAFTYTVPTAANNQNDVMLAYYTGTGTNGQAKLDFTHALTSVRFKIGTIAGHTSIKSIELRGVYSKGVCTPVFKTDGNGTTHYTHYFDYTNAWNTSSATKVTVKSGDGVNAGSGSVTANATLGTPFTFIIIPQDTRTSGNSVTIAIKFNDDIERTATISADNWEVGNTNWYTISVYDYDLVLSPVTVAPWNTEGIDVTLN